MGRCVACEHLAGTMPDGTAHDDLVQTGTARRKHFAQAVGDLIFYRCRVCGQRWELESGRRDPNIGWALASK